MANQIWIFHIHISKMTSKSQYEKNLDPFAPYYYDDKNHIDSLTPLARFSKDDGCRRTKELFFSLIQTVKYNCLPFVLNFLNK
jgi:hypothetical protein